MFCVGLPSNQRAAGRKKVAGKLGTRDLDIDLWVSGLPNRFMVRFGSVASAAQQQHKHLVCPQLNTLVHNPVCRFGNLDSSLWLKEFIGTPVALSCRGGVAERRSECSRFMRREGGYSRECNSASRCRAVVSGSSRRTGGEASAAGPTFAGIGQAKAILQFHGNAINVPAYIRPF